MQDVIQISSSVQVESVSKTHICVINAMTVETWLMSRTVNLQVYCTVTATFSDFFIIHCIPVE